MEGCGGTYCSRSTRETKSCNAGSWAIPVGTTMCVSGSLGASASCHVPSTFRSHVQVRLMFVATGLHGSGRGRGHRCGHHCGQQESCSAMSSR